MKQVDLKPGEYVQVPTKPLDKPSRLYWGMAVFAVGILAGVYLMTSAGISILLAVAIPLPAVLFGVGLAGRFPAFFFRRDR